MPRRRLFGVTMPSQANAEAAEVPPAPPAPPAPSVPSRPVASVAEKTSSSTPLRAAGGRTSSRPTQPVHAGPTKAVAGIAPDVMAILQSLRIPAMWLDAKGTVLWAHPAIESIQLVRRRRLRTAEIESLVEDCRSTGQVVQRDISVRRIGRRQAPVRLRVRSTPIPSGACLVTVEDISEAERLDHVRRDFVANVSHELKTPIGALSLLAEAVHEGRDDPEAVARFTSRMILETGRLTMLVNDLMDLSRLEGIDPQHPMEVTSIDAVVAQACDDARLAAQDKGIQFLRGGVPELQVMGVESQLVTAVRNLIVNAINYSPPSTKVAVTTGRADGIVTIAVTDQGIGIPPSELDRIFERFYRADPARSRNTGGTGLGLAIVKHVCANHRGDCDVWSRVGEGSTFTIRLPELSGSARTSGGHSAGKEEQ